MSEDKQQLGLRLVTNLDDKADELAERERERWGEGGAHRMTQLARMFPCLDEADGIEPWAPEVLIRWACGSTSAVGDLHAVRFVLQVWSPVNDWQAIAARVMERSGRACKEVHELARAFSPFNVAVALAYWDDTHRAGFLDWVELPFFP
jgi:hypothetical protein